jgi:CheY-like chemotaxis protein
LALDFDVAVASDGYQALEAVSRVDPDIVVLDISMPGLDGFQTAEALERRGSHAYIVFMSMHVAEEYVAKAFGSGGRGYVLKARLHTDLLAALDRVLAGQLFVPSLKSLFVVDDRRSGHAAHFYSNDHAWMDDVGGFLHLALRRGDAVSVVGTDVHRAGIAERLQAYGWRVDGSSARYRAIDADEALSTVVRNGRPDRDRIAAIVAELEQTRIATAPECRMMVVGEMTTRFLLNGGDPKAALEIERLWNEQTRALPFVTVCCYTAPCFSDEKHPDFFSDVCAEHWAVGHTPDGGNRSLPI